MAIDVPGILASILDPLAEDYYSRAKSDMIKFFVLIAGLIVVLVYLIKKR